jgi:hypothetical protein
MRSQTKRLILATLSLGVLLSACDAVFGEPVVQIPGIAETLAAQTLVAQTLRAYNEPSTPIPDPQDLSTMDLPELALNSQVESLPVTVQPTSTPIPTLTPNLFSTELPQEAFSIAPDAPCNAAEFIRDVTIPDDTIVEPKENFTKIWAIRNIGSCTWERNEYALVLFWGNDMGTDRLVPLQFDVQPAQTADLAIEMEAPIVPGCWVSNWMLQDGEGNRFGVGPNYKNYFWVQVNVWWGKGKIPMLKVG